MWSYGTKEWDTLVFKGYKKLSKPRSFEGMP
jgi:hypothetical protein